MTDEMKKKLGIKTIAQSVEDNGLKIILYGLSGAGKSTMIGTLPGTTLVLDTEKGLLVLEGQENIDVIEISKISSPDPEEMTLLKVYQLIKDGTLSYDNYVLDSITDLSETLFAQIDADDSIDKGFGGLYTAFRKQMLQIIKAFKALPTVNVVFIALADTIDINGMPKLFPSTPHKKTSMSIMSIFDECIYLETTAIGTRVIRTTDSGNHAAKSRSGLEDGQEVTDLTVLYPQLNTNIKA